MSRWLEIALTLVLFGAVMCVASWAVNATVPGFDDWLTGIFGQWGATLLVAGVILAAGVYGWRDHRKAGEKAKGNGV